MRTIIEVHTRFSYARFPLAGGGKRQGCVRQSTPEAEIVAADVTLRTMGLPALSIWEALSDSVPKLLFHDDNQGMIGVVRSGRNPTMRHLGRTHGISIMCLHEHVGKEHVVLMYWTTAKMAADIHTKGFKNPLAWQKACMLINLLDSGEQMADLVAPTTDGDTTVRQVFFSPRLMRSPIFFTLKLLYYHLKCIVRGFQAVNFKSYLE